MVGSWTVLVDFEFYVVVLGIGRDPIRFAAPLGLKTLDPQPKKSNKGPVPTIQNSETAEFRVSGLSDVRKSEIFQIHISGPSGVRVSEYSYVRIPEYLDYKDRIHVTCHDFQLQIQISYFRHCFCDVF